MGHNDHVEDDDLFGFLHELIESGHLDGVELGITKLALDKGISTLSEKQKFVLNEHVIKRYSEKRCSRCECPLPWSEMYASIDNGGLCNYCWHINEKLERE